MFQKLLIACWLPVAFAPQIAVAQSSAPAVAATMQSWRDACSDPNPDLALGYLMDAIGTNSVDVRKACLRQVLSTDNPDLQNSALRVLMTSIPVVRFRVTEEVPADAGRNGHLVRSIRTGLLFFIADGDQSAGTATWTPLIDTAQPVETSTGQMTVFGSVVHWVGTANYGGRDSPCALEASLTEGSRIVGTFMCQSNLAIPVEASLFD